MYKLVEIAGVPRIKLSQEVAKVMLPGQKRIYRIFKPSGEPLVSAHSTPMRANTEERVEACLELHFCCFRLRRRRVFFNLTLRHLSPSQVSEARLSLFLC